MRLTARFSPATFTGLLIALPFSLVAPSVASGVEFGQLDNFQDGTTMGWSEGERGQQYPPTNVATGGPGGAGDRYLGNISIGGFGADSRQVMFNQAQWRGNYNAAGVTRIEAQLVNLGTQPLRVRVAILDEPAPNPINAFLSTTGVLLPADGVWRPFGFDLTNAALTRIQGSASLATVLNDVAEVRILASENGDNFRGDIVASSIGVDNLRALRLPGDANFSGAVDGSDFALLAGNFGKTGQTWNTGDFNFDTRVDGSDFALLAGNFGRSIPASAAAAVNEADVAALEAFGASIGASPVPEPSALCLLPLAALLGRRARPSRVR